MADARGRRDNARKRIAARTDASDVRKADKATGPAHLVPLAPKSLAILRELRPLTGHGSCVFPSLLTGERCMSENTVRGALPRMGYGNDDMTAHGFRAMARTCSPSGRASQTL